MKVENDLPILIRRDSIALFKRGCAAWNEWVENNPDYNIDFSSVDFDGLKDKNGVVDFEKFKFPNGNTVFNKAKFGKGIVKFDKVKFGVGTVDFGLTNFKDCEVSFLGTKFSVGDINFESATVVDSSLNFLFTKFGEGLVCFDSSYFESAELIFWDTNFGDGNADFSTVHVEKGKVSFIDTSFGTGNIDFSGMHFGKGDVNFSKTNFGKGDFILENAKFKEGDIFFNDAQFGDGNVSFDSTSFDKGDVLFTGTDFGRGDVSFYQTKFKSGDVNFNYAEFNEGIIEFAYTNFGEGNLNFQDIVFYNCEVHFHKIDVQGRFNLDDSDVTNCIDFTFNGSSFNNHVSVENLHFNCIPDFTGTKLTNQLDLQSISVNLKREGRKWLLLKKTTVCIEAHRLRRLKEIAENNHHHEKALEFNALEMKAKRWNEINNAQSLLDILYSISSDYGRSIFRPFLWLIATIVTFSFIYETLMIKSGNSDIWNSVSLSLANSIPFLTFSKDARTHTLSNIVSNDLDLMYLAMGIQSMLSVFFIFLIALGLRNRFRI